MIVVGLGFGDEGKGLTTSFLTSKTDKPLVVRFNGGHQAGHTVEHNDIKHIFSHFGSGSFHGAPTYWSVHCTVQPQAFVEEFMVLVSKGVLPKVYMNPLCPVTTPYDISYNKFLEDSRNNQRHGSVGVGFGVTLERQKNNFKLFAKDLQYPTVLKAKLDLMGREYYRGIDLSDEAREQFLSACEYMMRQVELCSYSEISPRYTSIFEGAQGILLDQNFGFFPNVTRSYTTSFNAIRLLRTRNPYDQRRSDNEIYYVTRTYLTRHGAGFLPEGISPSLSNNEGETNKSHPYQGEFRTRELNIELLNYALESDTSLHPDNNRFKRNLVITCNDQYTIDIPNLLSRLNVNFEKVYLSYGPSIKDLRQYR